MESFWMTMLPFVGPAGASAGAEAAARAAGARAARRDHLRDDRRTAPSAPRSRRPAVDAAHRRRTKRRRRRGRMTDAQVRDEAMTIFLAGHETTANALTWTWYLLEQRAGRRGAAARRGGSRAAGPACRTWPTCASLPFVERVVTESMRLYPPAWLIGRRAIEPTTSSGSTSRRRDRSSS